MGGEPLLNPNLRDICIAFRRLFSPDETKLRIITNGILVSKCHWLKELIQDYQVHIQVSSHVLTGQNKNEKYIKKAPLPPLYSRLRRCGTTTTQAHDDGTTAQRHTSPLNTAVCRSRSILGGCAVWVWCVYSTTQEAHTSTQAQRKPTIERQHKQPITAVCGRTQHNTSPQEAHFKRVWVCGCCSFLGVLMAFLLLRNFKTGVKCRADKPDDK